MKNISMAILAAIMLASCVKKEEKPDVVNTTTETTVEKKVVVDTVAVKPAADPNGTTVKVGSDGVQIKSKDGSNNTSVEVKK